MLSTRLSAFVLFASMTAGAIAENGRSAESRSYESPKMVFIPGGRFLMGSEPASTVPPAPPEETPVRQVAVDAFLLSRYPVTFDLYDQYCMGSSGSCPSDQGWGRGQRPVINVSWRDAMAFIDWINENSGCQFRLPSEAEWEYAARAGTSTNYPWGDEMRPGQANCRPGECGEQFLYTAPVGTYPANPFGLHDMHGNVWEWVADCWNPGYEGAPADGSAWLEGACRWRVLRGGSWANGAWWQRSASRFVSGADNRRGSFGFRLAHDALPGEDAGERPYPVDCVMAVESKTE